MELCQDESVLSYKLSKVALAENMAQANTLFQLETTGLKLLNNV